MRFCHGMIFQRGCNFRVCAVLAIVVAALGVLCAQQTPPSATPAGNVAKGRRAFMSNCTACHSTADENRATAPSLYGLAGRRAGTREGYKYSPAMKDSKLVWDDALLEKYLAKPDAVFPGTPMTTAISVPAMRADLVAYLKTLGAPVPSQK